jgi:nickel/cobalt transporter (NicO) family protein
MRHHGGSRFVLGLLALLALAWPVRAHPLGNFSIDHYSRLRVLPDGVRLRYVIDMAEIPAVQEWMDLDVDHDRQVSTDERKAYLDRTVKTLLTRLAATVNGIPVVWQIAYSNLTVPTNLIPSTAASSGPTLLRIFLDLHADFTTALSEENRVRYSDGNYPGRTGWKEIVVESTDDVRLLRSTAPRKDLSNELTRYPPNVTAPPQDVTAEITFTAETGLARQIFREENYIWLLTAGAGLFLVIRWRSGRPKG